MKIIAGVDCHKATHAIAFLDSVGKVVHDLEIPANPAGYADAIAAARMLGEVVWGLEGTGVYGRCFAKALLAADMTVFEVPGIVTKRHRKHATQHGKSDRKDARAIAEAVLRDSERLPRFRECEEQEALRLRYDQRDRLVRERTMLINRIRSNALRLSIDAPKDLQTLISLRAIRTALDAIVNPSFVEDALVDEMRFSLATIERPNEQILRLERLMSPFVKRLAPELLELRGVSVIVAAGLIGHCGDMRHLRNADAFAMRSATAPISWSSGKSQAVRLNVGGNRQLNRLLHVIATVQLRAAAHPGRIYYDRKRSEGKTGRTALRALKRTLATIVYYRLRLCQTRIENTNVAIAA